MYQLVLIFDSTHYPVITLTLYYSYFSLSYSDSSSVERHPDFRLFCCMNPATDIGKRSLPPNVRNRFTEFYVDELKDPADLRILITKYLINVTPPIINGIIK